MYLSSVRSLKDELRTSSVAGDPYLTWPGLLRQAPSEVALGVAPGVGRYDWRLAVHVVRKTPAAMAFADRAIRHARGEAEAYYVGAISGPRLAPLTAAYAGHYERPFPGCSIGHVTTTAGTLGAFGMNADGALVMLSNAHVLAPTAYASAGDCILQPGVRDGGYAHRYCVAALSQRSPVATTGVNYLDAATAMVLPEVSSVEVAFDGVRLRGINDDAGPGLRVWKIGRTTGLTFGRIDAVEVDDLPVNYGGNRAMFAGQITIVGDTGPFSLGGDSGALVLDDSGKAVALLFAGNDAGLTYATPISTVLASLDIRLY